MTVLDIAKEAQVLPPEQRFSYVHAQYQLLTGRRASDREVVVSLLEARLP